MSTKTLSRPVARGRRPRRGRSRPAKRWPPWLTSRSAEALGLLLLFGCAVAVRWPYLLRLSHFTDEIGEIRNSLGGLNRIQTRRDYAYETNPTWATYRHNLFNLLGEVARIISNPMRIAERRLHYLTSPYLLVAAGLCVVGLVVLARRRQILPLAALVSTAAIMPYFNHAYGVEGDRYLLTSRYIAFLR